MCTSNLWPDFSDDFVPDHQRARRAGATRELVRGEHDGVEAVFWSQAVAAVDCGRRCSGGVVKHGVPSIFVHYSGERVHVGHDARDIGACCESSQ